MRDNRQCSAIDPSRLIDSMRMTGWVACYFLQVVR